MPNKLLLVGLISLAITMFCSCSALNKQQKTTIKEFAVSAKTYADAPKQLITTYSECLFKLDKLKAAVKLTQDGVINEIDRTVRAQFDRTSYSAALNITYKLLDKYFQALLNLADVDTADAMKTNISTLGVNIDSLVSKTNIVTKTNIPIGLGTVTGNLFKYIGKRRISQQQLKYFKDFMQRGDAIISQTSTVLDRIILTSLIDGDLRIGDSTAKIIFGQYLDSFDAANKKPADFLKELNPIYLDIKTCYKQAILLMAQLSVINKSLYAAHHEVLLLLDKKDKKLIAPKVAEFIEAVDQLNDLIKQFKESDK